MPSIVYDFDEIAKNMLGDDWFKPAKLQTPYGNCSRPCTCHPDDHPPVPCAEQYALQECLQLAAQAKLNLLMRKKVPWNVAWRKQGELSRIDD